jgi:hypothetical protein
VCCRVNSFPNVLKDCSAFISQGQAIQEDWRHYSPSKHRELFTQHTVTLQKTWLFVSFEESVCYMVLTRKLDFIFYADNCSDVLDFHWGDLCSCNTMVLEVGLYRVQISAILVIALTKCISWFPWVFIFCVLYICVHACVCVRAHACMHMCGVRHILITYYVYYLFVCCVRLSVSCTWPRPCSPFTVRACWYVGVRTCTKLWML